jgi:hypothetical protein
MKYEKIWENLKIHAGDDDKLQIQFESSLDQFFSFSLPVMLGMVVDIICLRFKWAS